MKRRVTNKRKVIVVALVALLVLVGGLVACKFIADSVAVNYAKSLEDWRHNGRATFLAQANITLNQAAFPGAIENQKMLVNQKKACSTFENTATLADEKNNAPHLAYVPAGFLSNTYKQHQGVSQHVSQTVDSYTANVKSTYSQLKKDCEWSYTAGVRAWSYNDKKAKTDTLLVKRGTTPNGLECGSDTCLPDTAEGLKKYAQLYRDSYIAEIDDHIANTFNTCDATSLKPVCDDYKQAYESYSKIYNTYISALEKATDPSSDAVSNAYAQMIKNWQATDDELLKNIQADFPKDSAITKKNLSPDSINSWIAKQMLKQIATEQRKVKDL